MRAGGSPGSRAFLERGKPPQDHAALEFVTISEPVLTSAPGQLQTPRRGD